jgi:quinoprotein glucose dehydrogenase
MEERPAPQSKVPGEKLAKMQRHPTKPAPFELQGRQEKDLIDFTPEIRKLALERARATDAFAELFEPPRHRGNKEGKGPALICPGGNGGANITGPPAADPASGVIFITSYSTCTPVLLAPAKERDNERMTGKTLSDWARGGGEGPAQTAKPPANDPLAGIPSLFKGPLGRIVAIDMNTGEHLWTIPLGDMNAKLQEAFRNNPLLKGVSVDSNWGRSGQAAMMATSTLLFATGMTADDRPALFGIDKKTGKRLGSVPIPRPGQYGLMTYLHQGKQYVVVPRNGGYTVLSLQ